MLKEVKNVRQDDSEPLRRIFNGTDLYIITWEDDVLVAYQLIYNKNFQKYILRWEKEKGFSHGLVDEGGERPDRHKMSSITSTSNDVTFQYIAELIHQENYQDKIISSILKTF